MTVMGIGAIATRRMACETVTGKRSVLGLRCWF